MPGAFLVASLALVGSLMGPWVPPALSWAKPPAAPRQPRPKAWPRAVTDRFWSDVKSHFGPGPPPGAPSGSSSTTSNPLADTPAEPSASSGTDAVATTPATPSGTNWSEVISAEALENEVKLAAQVLAEAIARPANFSSKGLGQARRALATLSAVFAMAEQYPESVRFQAQAGPLARRCQAAAQSCREATPAALDAARGISEILDQLLNGGRPDLGSAAGAPAGDAAPPRPSRADLMARLEAAETELRAWTADPKQLQRRRVEALQEAAMVTALARWIAQPEYEFADDSGYQSLAELLESGGRQLGQSLKAGDWKKAADDWTAIGKSCVDCHSGFRT